MKATKLYVFIRLSVLLLISALPATAQSARQFVDSAGKPVSRGTLTLMRLGASRTVKLDKNGSASVQLDPRETYFAVKDSKRRFIASYSIIWAGSNYRLNALSCFGWSCSLDQKTNVFPARKP